MDEGPPAGIYVHLPFCARRCTYCDFPVVVGAAGRAQDYLAALEEEIGFGQPEAPEEADTVYLGGGTPSRMTPAEIGRLLEALGRRFRVAPDAEVTLEANPEDLDVETLRGFRLAGVNRLSLGVQSLDRAVLARVGRAYDGARALRALEDARRAGFRNVSADLILGLPGEDLRRWPDTVARVAAAGPDHVSMYLLEIDKQAPLAIALRRGRIAGHDDDALADAYEASWARLEAQGFEVYEISNAAREGAYSRHNLKYWNDQPYAGFGLGAHGYLGGARRANVASLDVYIRRIREGRDPAAWVEPPERERRACEALIFGLRTTQGVDLAELGRRYGLDLVSALDAWIRRGVAAGFLEEPAGSRLRMTRRGWLGSNELFVELADGLAPSRVR